MFGVANVFPVATANPPAGAVYQLTVEPGVAVAESVTTPGPHLVVSFNESIWGSNTLIFTGVEYPVTDPLQYTPQRK